MSPVSADIASVVFTTVGWSILAYVFVLNSFYAILLVSAAWDTWQHGHAVRGEERQTVLASGMAPSVSMLVPAFNEALVIGESVLSLLTLSYPALEIIVINDGSTDDTLAILTDQFELSPIHPIYRKTLPSKPVHGLYVSRSHPNLIVVDKENGSTKADALNVGVDVASSRLVCAIDADTLVEADAIQRMVRPFLTNDDVVAAGGTIRLVNGCRVRWGRVIEARVPSAPLAGFQVVEYLRAFLFGRIGWNRLGGNLIISGAFGLFDRSALLAAGGYASDAPAEDMELILRMRRHGHERGGPRRVAFIPDPVAWTEAPETLALGQQRRRWHRGLADALWRHRGVILAPRYGALGLVATPYYFFMELLAPVVEAVGLIAIAAGLIFGLLDIPFAILFFLIAYGYGLLLTVATLLLEEVSFRRYPKPADRLRLLMWAMLEPFGYRQLTVYWRLQGLIDFLRGRRDWGVIERRGFRSESATGTPGTTGTSGAGSSG